MKRIWSKLWNRKAATQHVHRLYQTILEYSSNQTSTQKLLVGSKKTTWLAKDYTDPRSGARKQVVYRISLESKY